MAIREITTGLNYTLSDDSDLKRLKESLRKAIFEELVNQGHSLTGAVENSVEFTEENTSNTYQLNVLINYYAKYLNNGVQRQNIPYNPGSGATKSAYIDALTRYAEKRFGLSGKKAVSAAFAIAKTHKKEGMPSAGSYAFSKNSRRTQWVDHVLKVELDNIMEFVNGITDKVIEVSIKNLYSNGTNN